MEDSTERTSSSRCSQASTNASAAYEMTGGAAGAAPEPGVPHHREQDPRKRPASHFNEGFEPLPPRDIPLEPSGAGLQLPTPRKRKTSSHGAPSAYDDDGEDARSTRTAPDKKQNHSEIEKRRRDKMNTYISELAAMVPVCGAMARKLDKLTVLRLAVQHLRGVRGALAACPLTARPRPAALSERALNALVLRAAQGAFVLVVSCDRGRLLYVSASAAPLLRCRRADLLGRSLFDVLHPKDVAKVKEQLSSSALGPRERLVDAKTMLPVKAEAGAGPSRLCPGARRSFFCRIRCRAPRADGPGPPAAPDGKYRVVQCTGYLKAGAGEEGAENGEEGEGAGPAVLVAVARALPPPPPPPARRPSYVSRHAVDGKYLFVDQRVTPALGFLAQELVGTSLYEYVSGPELGAVARAHKAALLRRLASHTPPYRFRRKDGTAALLQTHFKPFRNPWTKDVECLVAHNTLVAEEDVAAGAGAGGAGACAADAEGALDAHVQRLIESRVEAQAIGSAIAEEALLAAPGAVSPELPRELLAEDPADVPAPLPPDDFPAPLDGNGEAAIAVIMSLLEADAGLGGSVNFSGLPWPLP